MRALVILSLAPLASCNILQGAYEGDGFGVLPPPMPGDEVPCGEADDADCDGDGVVRAVDCDDRDPDLGALLYANGLDFDDNFYDPPEPLGMDWTYSGQSIYATSGGQEALLGEGVHWRDYVVLADVRSRGTESSCSTCSTLYRLSDHPDGVLAAPDYGLRLDSLFEGLPGATDAGITFSFDTKDAMVWARHDVANNTLRIFGTVYGGEDVESAYGFGEGHYQIYMVYNANVSGNPDDGWTAGIGEGELMNQGWIRSLDNPDTMGMQWSIYDYSSSGPSFSMLPDGHRLDDDEVTWVGRGALEPEPSRDARDAVRDFLFIADPLNCADRTYTAKAHEDGHAFWFVGLYDDGEAITRLDLSEDAVFRVDEHAGTATLAGTATVYEGPGLGDAYAAELSWTLRGVGPEYGGPKIERPAIQPEWLSDQWEYYDLVEGSLLAADGSEVVLAQMPADGSYPFQVGDSANNKDVKYGGSTWFTFERMDEHGALVTTGHGDLNATFDDREPVCTGRWRAGLLARAALDDVPDEGFIGYRCALARNSASDCFAEGHFLQIAAFTDDEEDDLSSECGETCDNPSFDQLARVDHDGGLDLSAGDVAAMRFYVLGTDLVCTAEDDDGNRVVARATDARYTEGPNGFSTLNMFGDFDDVRVCEALGLPD